MRNTHIDLAIASGLCDDSATNTTYQKQCHTKEMLKDMWQENGYAVQLNMRQN